MNIFHKVTLQSLKKNKTRTVVTIIGIILSAAMICAVTTFVSSMRNFILGYYIYVEGDWHGATANVKQEDYAAIRTDPEVSFATYDQILGYAAIDSANEFKPYLYVLAADPTGFFDSMPVHLVSGRLPENAREILIPAHALSNGGLQYALEDTLTLDIGDRLLDGWTLNQNNPCYEYTWEGDVMTEVFNGEILQVRETRTYTVVGIYERPNFESHTAPGYTAITLADGGDYPYDVYFRMDRPSSVYAYATGLGLPVETNDDVLMLLGISRYDSFSNVLYGLAAVAIGLIMFGSVSLIYNAFAISVSERTKQFGLLSSVGATKKQLRKMVLFEALAVSAVGIPLGILSGIGGMGVTLLLIGEKLSDAVLAYPAPLRVHVSWLSVAAAAMVALVTVLISAWIPSRRAMKVTAVEAIRQNADIQAKPAKTSRLTYKLFGLPGVIAAKHYKRNKKKYSTTVVSLFMSIVLFVSASAFSDYLMESVSGGFSGNAYDLKFYLEGADPQETDFEEVLELLTSEAHITKGGYAVSGIVSGHLAEEYITGELKERTEAEAAGYRVRVYVHFIDDRSFDEYLQENRLNRADYYDPQDPCGIALDSNISFNADLGRYVTLTALKGDTCQLRCQVARKIEGYTYMGPFWDENNVRYEIYQSGDGEILHIPQEEAWDSFTLRTNRTLTEGPYLVEKSGGVHLTMIYPLSMMDHVLQGNTDSSFLYYYYYLQSTDHAASYESLMNRLQEKGLNADHLYDYAGAEETNRNLVLVMKVFSYGFVVLISLIAAANVFNTISTNISLRRREFAMLKSVGMSQKGFHAMMNYECLLYGSKALLLGLPVSAGVTYLIYRAVSEGYETVYQLPWAAIAIAAASVFLVVFATMLYSMNKIKKDNPIDALKNENL